MKDPTGDSMRDDELRRLRQRVELQQRTIEAMRDSLDRTATKPRLVNIGPHLKRKTGTDTALRRAEAVSMPWWPAIAMPKSRLTPPAGLTCYSLSGANVAVIAFGVFGLEGDKLDQAVANVAERQRAAMNFVPLFLTDRADHEVFRHRGYAFEYFPSSAYGPQADALAFEDRLFVAWKKWGVGSLIDLGAAYYIRGRLAGTRIPELAAMLAPPLPEVAKKRSKTPSGKSAPKDTTNRAEKYYYKLWAGFSKPALDDLQKLIRSNSRKQQFAASWALARWRAALGEHQRALDHVAFMKALGEKQTRSVPYATLLEVHCLVQIGQKEQARSLLDIHLGTGDNLNADLNLAYANTFVGSDDPSVDDTRLSWINRPFLEQGFAPIEKAELSKPLTIDNLAAPSATRVEIPNAVKVSVIMPSYNAAGTIRTAIESVLAQTWPNLELIVVDDCSTDGTWDIIRSLAADHDAIIPVRQEKNQGAYAARNAGLVRASGDLFTTHDSDDWSHPQKIESQVSGYMAKPHIMGMRSYWARATTDMYFTYRRTPAQSLIFINFSSFIFKKEVIDALGRWDLVRTAADTEFYWRAEHVFGETAFVAEPAGVPLSFGLVVADSLTNAGDTHLRTIFYGLRRDYHEAAERWHQRQTDPDQLKLGFASGSRPFPAPRRMLPELFDNPKYDYLFILDFTMAMPAGSFLVTYNQILYCLNAGKRVAVFLWRRYDVEEQPLNPLMTDLIDTFKVDLVSAGDAIEARTVIVGEPQIVQFPMDSPPDVQCERLALIVSQTAYRLRGDGDQAYDPLVVRRTLKDVFGTEGQWIPVSGLVRRVMGERGSFPQPYSEDWPPLIDLKPYNAEPLVWRGGKRTKPVIGRHGRDHYTKWPSDPSDLRDAYCADKTCSVRILGGADCVAGIVGRVPVNWEIHPWNAMPVPSFLSELDFFVHYPHEDWIEAFGMAVVEAMAAGKPVILPPVFKETFGAAATYAEPAQVWDTITSLWRNKKAYLAQARAGRKFSKLCALDRMAERLEKFQSRTPSK